MAPRGGLLSGSWVFAADGDPSGIANGVDGSLIRSSADGKANPEY